MKVHTAHGDAMEHKAARVELQENNDCGIRAIAACTKTPYETVREYLNANGRKEGKGTSHTLLEKGFAHFAKGKVIERIYWTDLDVTTIGQLTRVLEGQKHSQLIAVVRKHGVGYVDGVCQDWSAERQHKIVFLLVARGKNAKAALLPDGVLKGSTPETTIDRRAKGEYARPRPHTSCGKFWEFLDSIADAEGDSSDIHTPDGKKREDVELFAAELGISAPTVIAQHFRWRKVRAAGR